MPGIAPGEINSARFDLAGLEQGRGGDAVPRGCLHRSRCVARETAGDGHPPVRLCRIPG
jgi:hypothetical protein